MFESDLTGHIMWMNKVKSLLSVKYDVPHFSHLHSQKWSVVSMAKRFFSNSTIYPGSASRLTRSNKSLYLCSLSGQAHCCPSAGRVSRKTPSNAS